jgi:hypothetical protein
MSIVNILIFLAGITFMTLAFRRRGEGRDIYRLIIESLSAYCVLVCIIAMVLLLCNIYDPLLALSITAVIPLAFMKSPAGGGESLSPSRAISKYRYIIVFMLLMVPVIAARYDYISMDADIGVYAIRGMQLQSEKKLFSEYRTRDRLHGEMRDRYDADNLLFFNKASGRGVYLPGTHMVAGKDSVFYFHAYPGWPALLATWGSIFGITKQHFVMIFLYVLVVSLLYFIFEGLSGNSRFSTVLAVLFGSSPLLVYFTKYGTAELFLLFLVLFAIHSIAGGRTLDMLFAGLSVTLFCLTHVSSFAYVPLLFLACYFFMHRKKAGRYYLFLAVSFLGFVLSIPYGYYVSRRYFRDIYVAMFSSVKLGLAIVLLMGLTGLAMSAYGYVAYRNQE